MKTAIVQLNFGEPEHPTLEEVVPFLERIFSLNAPLMGEATPEQVRQRSRHLAEQRAPGLIEEYEEIGGSPLARQAREQVRGLQEVLDARGHETLVLLGMQFTDPSIAESVRQAREWGADRIVGLPIYPLAGPSTTVAALAELDRAVREAGWEVPVFRISGWHRHPAYIELRAGAVRRVLQENDLSLDDPQTRLIFSAHGTPIKYLEEGNGYDLYVRDFCRKLADRVGAPDYLLGYQNHTNRPGVQWTQPDIDRVVAEVGAERIVVDPVSFMHEQSETLAELDRELREEAEARGLAFYRVPILHAAPEFITMLADLVEPLLRPDVPRTGEAEAGGVALQQCRCQRLPGTYCMNPPLHR